MSLNLTNRTASFATTALVFLSIAAPAAHAARTFCCADERNQQRCGDVLPTACRTRAYIEYNEAGIRVRSVERPLTDAEQAAKDADYKKQRELADAAAQQQRSDTALLSTYADEKDLDTARDRAVVEMERSVKSTEENLLELKKSRVKIDADKEFFKNKPLPEDMKQKIARSQASIDELQKSIIDKKKELEDTKAKFEGFRARLKQLKNKDVAETKP